MGTGGRGFFVRPGIPEFMRRKGVAGGKFDHTKQFEWQLQSIRFHRVRISKRLAPCENLAGARAIGCLVTVVPRGRSKRMSSKCSQLTSKSDKSFVLQNVPIVVNGAGDTTAPLF